MLAGRHDACAADDCRKAQSDSHDRRMGSLAADLRYETERILLIELSRIGRGHLFGNDDDLLVDRCQVRNSQSQDIA